MRLRAVLLRSVLASAVLSASPLAARPLLVQTGARIGVNAATLDIVEGLTGSDVDGRTGLCGGFWLRWGPERGFAVQIEALYSEKGGRLKGVPLPLPDVMGEVCLVDYAFESAYVEVPVLASFGLPVGGGRLYALAGPSFAYKLRARTALEPPGSCDKPVREYENNRLESNDTGLVLGAGVKVGRLLLEGRWTRSLGHVFKRYNNWSLSAGPNPDIRNDVLTGSVGVSW